MDKLEEELAPHAKGVDIALAAFGVGKGSAKMADEEVRKIEINALRSNELLTAATQRVRYLASRHRPPMYTIDHSARPPLITKRASVLSLIA
jgi:hypothetical protein